MTAVNQTTEAPRDDVALAKDANLSANEGMMEILWQRTLHDAVKQFQNHPEYKKILGVLLKYEIQMLLQRLAETGEESVVMTIKLTDGTSTVIGSEFGEKFLHCREGHVTDFKDQFVKYCHNSTCTSFEGVKTENFTVKEDKEDAKSHSPVAGNCSDQSPSECRPRGRKSSRKKQVDQTDQTVSNLVENIMKQAKENEISKHQIWAKDFVQVVDKENERSTGKSKAAYRRYRCKLTADTSSDGVIEHLDEANKAIEETVSQLVQNIKVQAQMKEKQNSSGSYRHRRKRTWQNETGDDSRAKVRRFSGRGDRGRRPRSIAACFPPLVLNAQNSLNSSSDLPRTVIKVEPVDNGYEDAAMERVNGESTGGQDNYGEGGEVLGFGQIASVSGAVGGWTEQRTESEDTGEIEDHRTVVDSGGENSEAVVEDSACASDEETEPDPETNDINDLSSMKITINSAFRDSDEELELPFVEEYYQKRGEQYEKVSTDLKKNSVSSSSSSPDISYIASPRKPGKYNLIHRGYCYIKDKVGKGNTVYWKCGRGACKGRVIQRDGESIRTQDHNHSPTLQFEEQSNKEEVTPGMVALAQMMTEKKAALEDREKDSSECT